MLFEFLGFTLDALMHSFCEAFFFFVVTGNLNDLNKQLTSCSFQPVASMLSNIFFAFRHT